MKIRLTRPAPVFFSVILLVSIFITGIGVAVISADVREPQSNDEGTKNEGKFSVLTYNVAGLPDFISASHPARNTARISEKLNAFDIVLAQEDFAYHDKLVSKAGHKYKSGPGNTEDSLGDGLGRFSIYPFGKVKHIAWEECYGFLWYANDCNTPKGFSVAAHQLAPGVEIDIYNLHMDAYWSKKDAITRSKQMIQLIKYMASNSKGRAVIIGGDWNLQGSKAHDMKVLSWIIDKEGLTDSCRALECGVERIDRILFRGNESVKITPVKYKAEKEMFRDKRGRQLSDHIAVSTVFEWQTNLKSHWLKLDTVFPH